MNWKWFDSKDLRAAASFAQDGGVAIYDLPVKGREKAHLYAADVSTLHEAALQLGLRTQWMLKGLRPHFELKGEPLREAKRKCNQTKEAEIER